MPDSAMLALDVFDSVTFDLAMLDSAWPDMTTLVSASLDDRKPVAGPSDINPTVKMIAS